MYLHSCDETSLMSRMAAFKKLVVCVGLLVTLMAPVVKAADDPAERRQEFYDDLKIMSEVYQRIVDNYVDEKDAKDIMVAGIEGMLGELDAHSNYLPPVRYEDLMMSTEGVFGGLGITIDIRDHYPTVVSPIDGTPAYYMGIQGGDQIIEIEGESSRDFTSREAVKLLRGKAGTKANIKIHRPGADEPIPLTITRDVIKIESVPYGFMIGDIGYIRIRSFARTTPEEVRTKLDELTAAGMKGLILDLRFNPGGLLNAAQGVSELFLPKDKLIVFTKGRLRDQNHSFYSEASGKVYDDVPLIVMVNGSSASASEIVSASIQDHDAGLVVGQTSYGKGSVQTVFRLDSDEALKLTTARYYTPSGRSIHKTRPRPGHEPASAADVDTTADAVKAERFDKEKFYTDSGRIVYGGGGITPDIEIDQDYLTDFEMAVERDGALFGYAVDYAAEHPDLPPEFTLSDNDVDHFKTYLAGREKIGEYLDVFGLSLSDSLFEANREFIDRGLRRELARRLHGATAAYKITIEADVQLHETLDLLKRAGTLPDLLALAEKWNQDQLGKLVAKDSAAESAPVHN